MDLKEFTLFKTSNSVRHPWESARLLFIKRLYDEYCVKSGMPSRLVLDIGCGDGYVVSNLAMTDPAHRFVGVDVNFRRKDLELLTSLYPYDNISFTNTRANLGESPGCILLLDVLEHIENDNSFLKNLLNDVKIPHGGVVIITVPAFNSLFSSHDEALGHYRRYSLNQLGRLMDKNGLKALECGYIFMGPMIYRCFEVLKERLATPVKGKDFGVSHWRGGYFGAKLIETILLCDALVCRLINRTGMTLWGLTCYAICRKRV